MVINKSASIPAASTISQHQRQHKTYSPVIMDPSTARYIMDYLYFARDVEPVWYYKKVSYIWFIIAERLRACRRNLCQGWDLKTSIIGICNIFAIKKTICYHIYSYSFTCDIGIWMRSLCQPQSTNAYARMKVWTKLNLNKSFVRWQIQINIHICI